MFSVVRFGCYHERNPKACHLLGDYWEGIKKDFSKVPTENHCLLSLYETESIFLDLENLLHLGHNNRLLNGGWGVPGGNRTRACLTSCRGATPQPGSELRRTLPELRSTLTEQRRTLLELRRTLSLSFAAPFTLFF